MGSSERLRDVAAHPIASEARPDKQTLMAFVAVVVFGGLNAIAVKQSVIELAPFWSAALRFLAAGALLLAFVLVARRPLPAGRSLAGALLYGIIAFGGSFGFMYQALREVPAGTAILFLALVPLMTFGLAILHGQERFQLQGLVGAAVALVGVAVVVADQLGAAVPLGPMLMLVGGALFVAEGGVILKWVPRSDPFGTNAVAMVGGGAVLLALSGLAGEAWVIPRAAETWLSLAYLVVLGSIALFGLYLFALQRWTASAVSYVTVLMPLVTLPVAAMLISERPSPLFVVGGAIALAGVHLGAFQRVRPGRSSATSLPECLPIDACGPAATQPGGRQR
jgi:drug/metabolite transporter (DMT)-like permease